MLPEVERLYQSGKLKNMALVLNSAKCAEKGYGYGNEEEEIFAQKQLIREKINRDDTAASVLLNYMANLKIKRAYCTPHVMEMVPNNNKAFLTVRFELLGHSRQSA